MYNHLTFTGAFTLFEHELFDNYSFEEIPLDRDIYLIGEKFISEYEQTMMKFFDGTEWEPTGYISYAAARTINENSVELSWYPNISDRFHEVPVLLPKEAFVACVASWQCDEKPHVFVKNKWIDGLYIRSFSVFALIDAIGVKSALKSGSLTREKLTNLRVQIDKLAEQYPNISFISFADSLLLKSNWNVGSFTNGIEYSYDPEIFIFVSKQIKEIYEAILGLSTYAVISQGSNEYYDDPLLHISKTQNHISLNSLGVPFAQLMDIEHTARTSIKKKVHDLAEIYMDQQYYHSLKFEYEFDKHAVSNFNYQTKIISAPCKYYLMNFDEAISNLSINIRE